MDTVEKTSSALVPPSAQGGATATTSYGDYHKAYYKKNKDKIWEKVKASDAYKAKYKRYYLAHKEEINRKHTERERAKRERLRAAAVIPAVGENLTACKV